MEPTDQILALRERSQQLYRSGKYREAVEQLIGAWELLPMPRETAGFSNVLAGEIAISYLEDLHNYTEALRWAGILADCHKNKIDSGEGAFLKGKIYYEMQQPERAKEQFSIALKKSEGRAFEGADKKYLELLKIKE
ncbi:MAG TPA: hypothetical protein VF421_19415 [Niabella sp.]